MLKKLLASALAVATVASCAYVPSALASAATTYKTATVVDYADWELKNPPATETKETATIYVSSNANIAGTYALKVAAGDNNADYVKSKIADAKKTTDNTTKLPAIKPDSTDLTRYVLSYFGAAGNGTYVAQITEEKAVVYSEWDEDFAISKVANTSADELAKKHAKLLGYYADPAAASVVADMYKANLTGKLAGKDFLRWVNVGDGAIKPVFENITYNNIYYTKVKLNWLDNNTTFAAADANRVTTGLYINTTMTQDNTDLILPNNDSANWNTYLTNWMLTWGTYGDIFTVDVYKTATTADGSDDYTAAGVRYVGVKADQKQYTVIYSKDSKADGKDVSYTLTITDKDTPTDTVTWTGVEQAADYYYTTDVAEIYKIVKANPSNGSASFADKATLADYLVKDKADNGFYYTLTDKYVERTVVNSATEHSVTINVYVERADKYTVYSYTADNTMKKSDAFLTKAQLGTTYYANQDGNGQLTQTLVIKATAADLGVATEAVIDGVPATYAYVLATDVVGKEIYTTYKMGDATVALADFQTATGAFDSAAYFCRDAKVGDQVTLKVSLTDAGVAKKLELANLKVVYTATGAATVGENFDYAATEFPAGVATTVTLGQGTNIVTATVYYNGAKIGTFEPFYAYVG